MGSRLLLVVASVAVAGLAIVTGCGEPDVDDDGALATDDSSLTGCGQDKTDAEVSCGFTPLMRCAYPSTCKAVAGLGKGRKVDILQSCQTNGHYRVRELNNKKEGWVDAKCLSKPTKTTTKPTPKPTPKPAPKPKDGGTTSSSDDDAGTESTVQVPAPPPADTEKEKKDSDDNDDDDDKTSLGGGDQDAGTTKKTNSEEQRMEDPKPKKASSGCLMSRAPTGSTSWWMFALATLPLLRRKSRRPQ